MVEVWRVVPSIPALQASSLGRIAETQTGRIKKQSAWGRSLLVSTPAPGRRMLKSHRVICEAFHGPPPFPEALACHRDSDHTNNRASNLYWGTAKENHHDRYLTGDLMKDALFREDFTERVLIPRGRSLPVVVTAARRIALLPNEFLLTEAEAAAYLVVRPETLAEWRRSGRGPPVFSPGHQVYRYRLGPLRAWVVERER